MKKATIIAIVLCMVFSGFIMQNPLNSERAEIIELFLSNPSTTTSNETVEVNNNQNIIWNEQLEQLPALTIGTSDSRLDNYSLELTLQDEHEYSSVEIFSGGILKAPAFKTLKLRTNIIRVHEGGIISSPSGILEFAAHTIIVNGVVNVDGIDNKEAEQTQRKRDYQAQ